MSDGRAPSCAEDMAYVIVPGVLGLVSGRLAASAAGKVVRLELPGSA